MAESRPKRDAKENCAHKPLRRFFSLLGVKNRALMTGSLQK
jgi:hypothetical protein